MVEAILKRKIDDAVIAIQDRSNMKAVWDLNRELQRRFGWTYPRQQLARWLLRLVGGRLMARDLLEAVLDFPDIPWLLFLAHHDLKPSPSLSLDEAQQLIDTGSSVAHPLLSCFEQVQAQATELQIRSVLASLPKDRPWGLTLQAEGHEFLPETLPGLATAPAAHRLRSLSLAPGHALTPEVLPALLSDVRFSSLTALLLPGVGDKAVSELPWLEHAACPLERLESDMPGLTLQGIQDLANSPCLRGLKLLGLGFHQFYHESGDRMREIIKTSRWLKGVDLSENVL